MTTIGGKCNFAAVDAFVGDKVNVILVVVARFTLIEGSLSMIRDPSITANCEPGVRWLIGITLKDSSGSYSIPISS